MIRFVMPALLLALTACDGGSEGANSTDGEESPPSLVQEGVPENLTDDANNTAVPISPPAASTTPARTTPASEAADPAPAAANRFPAALQGRWGLVAADCEPGRSDAKGLMEVGPDSLRFYESRGTAQRLAQPRPGRFEATLAFTGEGMEWTNRQALTLSKDGRTLVREQPDPPTSLRYTRCPKTR